MDRHAPYNEGSHYLSVPELRKLIFKWKAEQSPKYVNKMSKKALIDFALEHDLLKKHFEEKGMMYPPPADSVKQPRPKKKAMMEEREKKAAEKSAAKMAEKEKKKAEREAKKAAKAAEKAAPKKRGRKPKAAPVEEKKEEPKKAADAVEPKPKKKRMSKKEKLAEITAKKMAEGAPDKVAKKLAKIEMKYEPKPEGKKLNAYAQFVKDNKKPGMSMKDVAELYRKSKASPAAAPKAEEKKEEMKAMPKKKILSPAEMEEKRKQLAEARRKRSSAGGKARGEKIRAAKAAKAALSPAESAAAAIGDAQNKLLPEALQLPAPQKDKKGGASIVNLTPVLNAVAARPSNVAKAPRGASKTQGEVPELLRKTRQLKKGDEAAAAPASSSEPILKESNLKAQPYTRRVMSELENQFKKSIQPTLRQMEDIYKSDSDTKREELNTLYYRIYDMARDDLKMKKTSIVSYIRNFIKKEHLKEMGK